MRTGLAIVSAILLISPALSRPTAAAARTDPKVADVDVPAAEGFRTMVANDWLLLLDGNDYQGGYDTTAATLKSTTTSEEWTKKVRALRRPLGKMLSRKAAAAAVERSLPGLSDGVYVVVEFDSAFEHKKKCVEDVTVVQEQDGALKVVRYAILSKPRLPRNRPPPPTDSRLPGG